jgi:hypothetical protein
MAEKVFEREKLFDDGTFVEARAHLVEPDEHFVEGVKYSFQYCDTDGENILRYDNARHPGTDIPRHHRHVGTDEAIEPVEYAGSITKQFRKFKEEIR